MRRLTLSEYSQVADIVAAVAVVVSLVYVGVSLQDNTSAIRSSSVQALTTTSLEALSAQAASEDLSRIRRLGDADYSALTEDEKFRYYLMYRQVWLTFQNVFVQRNLEVIGDDVWETYERIICNNYVRPGVQATWQDHRSVLDPAFIAVAEACSLE